MKNNKFEISEENLETFRRLHETFIQASEQIYNVINHPQFQRVVQNAVDTLNNPKIQTAIEAFSNSPALKQLNNFGKSVDSFVNALSEKLNTSLKGWNPPVEIFRDIDYEELNFNIQRLKECEKYFEKLDPDVSLQEIFEAIEGVPFEDYESVLLSKFGEKKTFSTEIIVNFFKALVTLQSIYTALVFYGAPLPPTFPEFIEAVFSNPIPANHDTQQSPAIPQGIDKQLMVSPVRVRKERCDESRGIEESSLSSHE